MHSRPLPLVALAFALACASDELPPGADNPSPFAGGTPAQALQPGDQVPTLSMVGLDGTVHTLGDGTVTVLEFFNPDCPFVDDGHRRGTLRTLPTQWAEQGVRWLAVNSNRPGTTGSGAARNRRAARSYGLPLAVVLDETSQIARAFGATVTPTLAVIDAAGMLAYFGGPDNAPLGASQGLLQRYGDTVLEAVVAGEPTPFARQKAYGCTIKF